MITVSAPDFFSRSVIHAAHSRLASEPGTRGPISTCFWMKLKAESALNVTTGLIVGVFSSPVEAVFRDLLLHPVVEKRTHMRVHRMQYFVI